MLEPHIKYLYGRLNNLFCLINHSQYCAKISSCSIFNGNATKRASVRTDGQLHTPRAPPAYVVAHFGPRGFAPAVARLAAAAVSQGHLHRARSSRRLPMLH